MALTPDRIFDRTHFKKVMLGSVAGAALSGAVGTWGIYNEWISPPPNPIKDRCAELTAKVYSLESHLFKSGTLGSDGGLVVRYLEIRNPSDPQLPVWGQLKNEKDQACTQAQQEYINSPIAVLTRISAIAGPIFSLAALGNAKWARKMMLQAPS